MNSVHKNYLKNQGLQVSFLFASWIRYLFEKQDLETEINLIPMHSASVTSTEQAKRQQDPYLQHNTEFLQNKKSCFMQNSNHSSDLVFDVLTEEQGSYKQRLQTP